MKKISISVLCLLTLGACNSKQTSKTTIDTTQTPSVKKGNMNIEAIKKQIALQKGMETNSVPDNRVHFLDEKDIELSLSVIDEGLAQAGYKKPDKADFEKKIKEIYNCENNEGANWKGTSLDPIITPASWRSGADFIKYYSDNYGETERKDYRMVAFADHNFIFDLDFLRNLIELEPDGKYKITIPQNIIARNRYLFNDNKDDLSFLVNKDKDFLKTLVAVFGYDKEPEINGAVLSEYNTGTNDDENIGQVVFDNYIKPGRLTVRKGLLKYIYDHTTESNNNMAKGLSNFVFKFSDLGNYSKISFEDKCKMLAYAGTLEQQLRDKYLAKNPSKWDPNALLTNFKIQWPAFIDQIKKDNYYNDPEIKKSIATAEDEAAFVTRKPDPE
jgi:hypothetical protein